MNNNKYIIAFVLLAVFATSAFSQRRNRAPEIRFGVRAGLNMSDLTSAKGLDIWNGVGVYDNNLQYKGLEDTDPFKFGFNAGLTAQVRMTDNWYIQPSLLLVSKGYRLNATYVQSAREYKLEVNAGAYYFQIPIDVVYKYELTDNFRFIAQAGVFVGYGSFGYTDFEDHFGEDTVPRQFHLQVNRPDYDQLTGEPIMVTTDPTVHGSHLYWKDRDDTFIPEGTYRWDAGLQIGLGFEFKSFAVTLQYQYSLTPLYNYDADFSSRYREVGIKDVHNSFEYLGETNPGSPHQHVISLSLSYYLDALKATKKIRW
ncbi:MAG: PorT family protein [Bacteroidales bacterium]|jgi:hypothetical protein|nr:PorT family protein [Bacteroidales bacterium]